MALIFAPLEVDGPMDAKHGTSGALRIARKQSPHTYSRHSPAAANFVTELHLESTLLAVA